MEKIKLGFENVDFEVLEFKPVASSKIRPTTPSPQIPNSTSTAKLPTVIFATGGGGNPERHLSLLEFLAANGFHVIAPYFERITSARPSHDELRLRINILRGALNRLADANLPVAGVGHSLGATLLLALAGGDMWMQNKEHVPVTPDARFKKVVMMTPPTGFFKAPNALDHVRADIQAWAGALDTMTPPEQLEVLKSGLSSKNILEIHIIEKAAHFSFMNVLPPHVNDPMSETDRAAFLSELSSGILKFLLN